MRFIETLNEIKDTRDQTKVKHKLVDVLLIILFGFLNGFNNIEAIKFFADECEAHLTEVLGLKNGIPSADTMNRILAMIDGKELAKAFTSWMGGHFRNKDLESKTVAIDGKTMRGSGSKTNGQKNAHIITAFASELGVSLSQIKTDEKTNEITMIPQLLDLMDLRGIIVTIDAMGCQKKIVEKIEEKKSDYVISLKGNQSILHDDVREFFEGDEKMQEEYGVQKTEIQVEKDHGRIECREYRLCTNIDWLEESKTWAKLNGIGMVKCRTIIGDKETVAVRYFITSLKDVNKAAKSMREHWGIENSLHWVLDMVYNEDYQRNRKDHTAENLSVIRKIALNLFKLAPIPDGYKNLSVTKKQILFSRNADYMKKVLYCL